MLRSNINVFKRGVNIQDSNNKRVLDRVNALMARLDRFTRRLNAKIMARRKIKRGPVKRPE